MKILHIASFKGNVGDVVNHNGFYDACNIDENDVTQLEMRRFYRNVNDLHFDDDLVKYINSFDRLILGGGAYFDIRYAESQNGTTLDMSDEFIEKINIPVLVNAIGVDVDWDNEPALDKFRRFFTKICTAENWKITLRNDGSKKRLLKIMGTDDNNAKNIKVVPDNGYIFNHNDYDLKFRGLIGLSITNDLFSESFNGSTTTGTFNQVIVEICNHLLDMGKNIIFFIHAPQDIETFYKIYSKLDKTYFRSRINIAPYDVSSVDGARRLDECYRKCEFVIAMRFHGNVLAIKNNIPVIGLAGHEQISGMYEELGLFNQCVIVNPNVKDGLLKAIYRLCSTERMEVIWREQNTMDNIMDEHEKYSKFVNQWLYA